MHADEILANLRIRREPRVFVISGPSGVGKDTVIERLRDIFPDIYFSVTATTRTRRPGEIDGVHYFFFDRDTFEAHLATGEFLESAVVYDHLYGVPRGPIRQALARGQDAIVKVDVQGAATIRQLAPNAVFIFLAPESMSELLRRLRARKTDDPEALIERFQAASREIASAQDFDYVVFNESDQVDQAMDTICAIITAERARIQQSPIEL
jgi:guanylate kinase